MKRILPALVFLLLSSLLSGCQNDGASFTNCDGTFSLSPNGTYTQTLPQEPAQNYGATQGDKDKKPNPLDALPETGSWRLISPGDGYGHSDYSVELSDVHRANAFSRSDIYTLVMPVGSIRGFSKIVDKLKR